MSPAAKRKQTPSETPPGPDDPVTRLGGVGPARAGALALVGIRSLGELVRWPPRAFEAPAPTLDLAQAAARPGQVVRVRGRVGEFGWVRFGRARRSALRVKLEDTSGSLPVLFVGQPWRRGQLEIGSELELEGRVTPGARPSLVAPRVGPRRGPDDRPRPVYPRIEGLSADFVRELIERARLALGPRLAEDLPLQALERAGLPPLPTALAHLHAPPNEAAFGAARRRLALEALLGLQARWVDRLARRDEGRAPVVRLAPGELDGLFARLPFQPTGDQRRATEEIVRDLGRKAPMRRLLHGDVGSGKTAVALVAAAAARAAGVQSAFLAPTEILAEQHHEASGPFLEATGLRAELLVGSAPEARRRAVSDALAEGELDLVFGTHALLGSGVRFRRLGLALIDEQHRFGVAQRRRLLAKGEHVHALLMTATPIPRTLALALYGDLDVSTLRERPPGRVPARTRLVDPARLEELAQHLARRPSEGRVLWVLPRIEGGEAGRGAQEAAEALGAGAFAARGVALVHGRVPGEERRAALAALRAGEVGLLVGTTVLEVGVDLPEADAIVIEGAERFGLAQLHQLRGRVGRGGGPSECFLVAPRKARERLEVLEKSSDGFEIAEADLTRRGMGDLAGLRQAGVNAEGLAGFEQDLALWSLARELVSRDEALRARWLR